MSLIAQRETNINLVSTYQIRSLRSLADVDQWFATVLLPSDVTIRRIQLENSNGLNSEGAGTMEIEPKTAAKGLSAPAIGHDADYLYFNLTYANVNLTVSIHLTDWVISVVGKKKFASQLNALAAALKLNEE